jgi:NitT/TauT family transport system substrate-binding protein
MGMKLIAAMAVLAASLILLPRAQAESIKIGSNKLVSGGPIYVAIDKGYFAEQGLDAHVVFFAAALPIAVATVSGDIDFGSAGLTAALYQLGGQGQLRIVAGNARDIAGFPQQAFVASNKAYEAGLKTYRDIAGKSVAIAEIGAPAHYTLAQITAKYGVDLKTVRLLPMQSVANVISAVAGAQADAADTPTSALLPAIQKGDVKLIGYPGDEVPFQNGAVVIKTKTGDERSDLVQRYLRGLRKGARTYHDAFVGPDEKPRMGAAAPDVLAIISKYTEQPVEQIGSALPYIDADARLDVKDVLRQIAWYKSQGMIKGEVEGDKIIDKRYVVPLPEN